jgi:ribosomal protein S19
MHKRIYIKNGMIGFKLGEFVFTKKLGSSAQ